VSAGPAATQQNRISLMSRYLRCHVRNEDDGKNRTYHHQNNRDGCAGGELIPFVAFFNVPQSYFSSADFTKARMSLGLPCPHRLDPKKNQQCSKNEAAQHIFHPQARGVLYIQQHTFRASPEMICSLTGCRMGGYSVDVPLNCSLRRGLRAVTGASHVHPPHLSGWSLRQRK
jgi:hypothetical protein